MKYISKKHLILLVIIVLVLGGMLLAGEKLTNKKFRWSQTSDSASPVLTDKEGTVIGNGNIQNPILETPEQDQVINTNTFIIRPNQNKLSYTQALDLYKNSLIQINENCQVTSSYKKFNLNNEIMIDNRSSVANVVGVGESFVVVRPYDFSFMILKEEGDLPVNCGDKKNVAIVEVK